jgi:hypothetical protein
VYSDFYKIPLPALRFEKTEEIVIEETTRRKRCFQKKTTLRKTTSKPVRENDVHQLTDHSKDLITQKQNLRTTILKKETTLSKENDTQKTTSKPERKMTLTSKDLRNHRSLIKRI